MDVYKVKVVGELLVSGKSPEDVRECLRLAQLACTASVIRFLDIECMELLPPDEQPDAHPHPH